MAKESDLLKVPRSGTGTPFVWQEHNEKRFRGGVGRRHLPPLAPYRCLLQVLDEAASVRRSPLSTE